MFNLKNKLFATLLLAMPCIAFSQFNISGKITHKNEPIIGVTIRIENTFITSQSSAEGTFEIKDLDKGTYVLSFSSIGFKTKQDTIILFENKNINIELDESLILIDEVIVQSTRVNEKSAMAYSNLNKQQIAEQNLGQDLPFLLNTQPSVVTTSDAGNGVGYTGIRIRGTDATRVNVTINGIPVNDAESQGTFWVDLPDIASSIDNIQIQRGVGTSTNGAGAFGGSLNIQTTKLNPKAYAEYNTSYGSFNTLKNTVNAGTGLINNKFAIDARLSKITSDGFIDRATSDLKSYYLSAAYYVNKSSVKLIHFSGLEETYQAWNGIPESRLNGDTLEMNNYIIRNGLDASAANHLLKSNSRTFNEFSYKNQIDRYKQDYYQLHFSHELNRNLNANISLHYTKGKGYYEEFKNDQAFSNYGYNDLIIGNDTILKTNLVRRRWLDNDFYGTTFSLNYNSLKAISVIIGGGFNQYDGLHYGEIIWAKYASNSSLHQNYYNDTATKKDFNIFAKTNYLITEKINVFTDLQIRKINYSFLGFNNSLKNEQQTVSLIFLNPKFGINYDINPNTNIYASYSIGNKEPSRADYTQSTPTSRPKHETLQDIEAGYKQNNKIAMWGLNLYYMNYKNQLVLTGEINDVGAYTRTNVDKSYRLGAELEFGIKPIDWLTWTGNLTISRNKINIFKEFIDNYDTWGQDSIIHTQSDIAFSPNVIASSTVTFEPIKNLKINFISKYVGQQFLDNTSNDKRKLDAFFVNDLRINYNIKTKYFSEIGIILAINNLLSHEYESNGYTWGYIYNGERTTENFYYPQAGKNYMLGLGFKF